MAAVAEIQPTSQLGLVRSPLSEKKKAIRRQLNMCQRRIPSYIPSPSAPSFPSVEDVPDILEEPAYIPHVLQCSKETAEERASKVPRASALVSLYSASLCVRVCVVLFNVVLHVAGQEASLVCRLQPGCC